MELALVLSSELYPNLHKSRFIFLLLLLLLCADGRMEVLIVCEVRERDDDGWW